MALPSTALLRELFDVALGAAQPRHYVPRYLPAPPRGRTVVVGAGKAAAAMAQALEAHWPGSALDGVVVTPSGYGALCDRIEVLEAGHPVPDDRSVKAAQRLRGRVEGLGPQDLVVALFSGGGSALLCEPAAGLSLADKQDVTGKLLRSGASIREINCVRQHLSRVKGGALAAAAAPAAVHTLIVSDVPGDDPVLVASGPTVPSPFTPDDAEAVLARYGIDVPNRIHEAIRCAGNGPRSDQTLTTQVICSSLQSLDAAAECVRTHGLTPVILSDRLEGEAREVGVVHAGIARSIAQRGHPVAPPAVVLSGGETSVRLAGDAGRGGRNTEFLLGLATALDGAPGVAALACDTDGIDGSERNAGAVIDSTTLARARQLGLDPAACLARHDAFGLFEQLDDLVVTGPTLTNVNDFRAILVEGPGS